jgi:tetratricopeptide (TPR) repeat protein
MGPHHRLLGLWLFGLVAVHPLPLAAQWQRLDAPGFSIYSDCSTRDIERFALDYAAFRQTVHEFFAPDGARPQRTVLILFKSKKAFEQHAPPAAYRGDETVAVTTLIDSAALFALPLAGARDLAVQMAFEFETMHLLRAYGYVLPQWMSQGSGQVLSTLKLQGGQRAIGYGDGRIVSGIRLYGLLEWERFFEINQRSPEYHTYKGQFHGQAWMLMHWVLLTDENGPQRFRELAQRLKREPVERALESVMGSSDLRQLRWTRLMENPPMRRLPFDEAAIRSHWKLRKADAIDVQLHLADLLVASGQAQAADLVVLQSLAAAPSLAAVQEAAARRALRQRNNAEAVDHYRRAIAAGSENPMAYVSSAQARLDESRNHRREQPGGGLPRVIDQVLSELRIALQLDPGNPQAYQLLGRAFYLAPELPVGAIEELSRGVGPGFEGLRLRLYRGTLFWKRQQDHAAAREDFAAVAHSPEVPTELRREARNQLNELALDHARQTIVARLNERDVPSARAALEAAQREIEDPQVLAEFGRIRQWLEEQAGKIEALRGSGT